jgi:hypothetical protein
VTFSCLADVGDGHRLEEPFESGNGPDLLENELNVVLGSDDALCLGRSRYLGGVGQGGAVLGVRGAVAVGELLVEGFQPERDFLVDELARAVRLGGRGRRAASHAERARLDVTRAIRAAMANLAHASSALGRHLAATIRTGRYCSYTPNPRASITWETVTRRVV